jgi:exonuclease VII small subunit
VSATPQQLTLDTSEPLSDEMKAVLYQHGTQLMRALVTELATVRAQLRDARRERDEAVRRLRDRGASPD